MKPMIIVPPGLIDAENLNLLRENEICVVVVKDPSKVKFVDPIPAAAQRTKMQDAAIKLTRVILSGCWGQWTQANYVSRGDAAKIFVDLLVQGTELDRNGSIEEVEEQVKQKERLDELRRLAREEARAEREKNKQPKSATDNQLKK